MTRIYKLLTDEAWAAAKAGGRFEGSEVDLRDGYIHFSTGAQAAETARRHFHGQEGLVLLGLDAEPLGAALKWEPSRGGELFPHLYAALDPALVDEVRPLALAGDGTPQVGLLR